MGRITLAQGDLKSAAAWYAVAAERRPAIGQFHHDLAVVLSRLGRTSEAIEAFQRAVELNPTSFGPTMNLARELERADRPAQAEAMARRALSLKADSPEPLLVLGNALAKQGRLHEAHAALAEAIRRAPPDKPFRAFTAMGLLLEDLGRTAEAIDAHRRALASGRAAAWLHSNYLYALRYGDTEAKDPAAVFREHAGWAARFARPLYGSLPPPDHDPAPGRRLRIGYLSADFRRHSASNGMGPLVRHHDRAAFEVWCYSDAPKADDVTERFRAAADQWREVRGLGDEQLARTIREDRIDVLVDHTGHMGQNRMMVFARRPAPVQVALPGYPGTTGLETIDAFVTDAYQDPPGQTEQFYTERLVRLAGSPRCYAAPTGSPEAGPLPADGKGGAVTFAVLQRPAKLTDRMFGLWAKVLNGTPNSRLVMLLSHAAPGELEREFTPRLHRHGIDPARVELVGRLPGPKYRALFDRVDVVLDTQPYAGCVTTMDALWMGVPVVTLAGRTYVARVGASILAQLGLYDELVAQSDEQYVLIATRLAADLPRLRELRSTLRQRMVASPLLDGPRVAREFEAACRSLWEAWCAKQAAPAAVTA